mgnify:CR=1 FL=1
MKKLLFLGALLLSTVCMNAQTSEYYQEAANPIATNPHFMGEKLQPHKSAGEAQTSAIRKRNQPLSVVHRKV